MLHDCLIHGGLGVLALGHSPSDLLQIVLSMLDFVGYKLGSAARQRSSRSADNFSRTNEAFRRYRELTLQRGQEPEVRS